LGLKNTIWFYATAAGVLVIDQLTKLLARVHLLEGKAVTVIPRILDLRLTYNSGAAFGLLPDWAPLFILVGLVAIFAIVRLRRVGAGSRSLSVGLGLLLGGALGNVIDRLALGRVTDFVDISVKLGGYQWPTFNVADMAIVVGAIMVLIHVYLIEKRQPAEEQPDAQTGESNSGAAG
jgi:signal peptidase II